MKFIVLVEGHAENKAIPAFLKRWLDPRLNRPVGVKSVRHDGWAEMIKDAPIKTKLHLANKDVIAVIGLLDLYGPTVYPAEKATAREKYDWLKAKLEKEVNQIKFRQFFAVHEFEAWLLSQPNIFPVQVREGLPPSARNPEAVNNIEPPKKLLKRLYFQKTGRSYKETIDAPDLFSRIDPSECYAKCPSLKALLDEMLNLAKCAGL